MTRRRNFHAPIHRTVLFTGGFFEGDRALRATHQMEEYQQQENKAFSSNRIIIEHLIRRVKVFQIAAQRFRLRPQTYQQVILTVCGLVRLRIGASVLPT